MFPSSRPQLPDCDTAPALGHQSILAPSHDCVRARSRRTRRPQCLSFVWTVAQHPCHRDVCLIESWLPKVIARTVAISPCSGDRVLRLASLSDRGVPSSGPRAMPSTRAGNGLLRARIESAGTAGGLRRVLAAHAVDPCPVARVAPGASLAGEQSARRLPPESVCLAGTDCRPVRRCRRRTAAGPDRFDAVIVTVDSSYPDWAVRIAWSGFPQPSGALALITHSDCQWGRPVDPGALATRVAFGAGPAPFNRVAFPHIPMRTDGPGAEPELLTEWPGAAPFAPTRHRLARCRLGAPVVGPGGWGAFVAQIDRCCPEGAVEVTSLAAGVGMEEQLVEALTSRAVASNEAISRLPYGVCAYSLCTRQLRIGDFR